MKRMHETCVETTTHADMVKGEQSWICGQDCPRSKPLETGDWVAITGRIVELHPNGIDLGVELFSKTNQYTAFVRRDLCAPTAKPIPDEPAEGSVALFKGRAYQRVDDVWVPPFDTGVEILRWRRMHEQGDVEVIHHA